MKKLVAVVFATIVLTFSTAASFGKINTYSGQFGDVKDNAWYFEDVKTAYEIGLVNGRSENMFEPGGNVTVIEGLVIASRIHSVFYDKKIDESDKAVAEYIIDFDDESMLIDLSKLNSRNDDEINLGHASGRIENGVLVVQPDKPNSSGNYDPQIVINGLMLDSKEYNKITFRMKRDKLDNVNPDVKRNETVEIFFKTTASASITQDKCIYAPLPKDADLEQWFEVTVEAGKHEAWMDFITGIRFDPTNNNGVYYVDWIKLSKSEKEYNQKWYDIYVDYAIDNGIYDSEKYSGKDYNRNITRKEMCDLFAAAIPEQDLMPINNINGIPDVMSDDVNADVYLMLYNAGVILGDKDGNFNGASDIKRSEISAIINRIAFPKNRVRGQVNEDWTKGGSGYDFEFQDKEELQKLSFEAESTRVENGALVLKARDRGADASPQFDPRVICKNTNIDADKYTRLRVRVKPEYIGDISSTSLEFFFTTQAGENFSEEKALHLDYLKDATEDLFGWYVFEIDLAANSEWKGVVNAIRFDPANTNGIYKIDYIRFTEQDPLLGASHDTLVSQGYVAEGLLQDADFENGFYVSHYEQHQVDREQRKFVYGNTNESPLWDIGPWWCGYDLWENRDETADGYTLKDDKGINTVVYNPEEKSLSMRVDATKIYNGKPHINDEYKWWPHLLIDQGFRTYPVDKEKNSATADRMYVELDMRVADFKDTTNKDGINNCSFLTYFYFVTDKDPQNFIWFGLQLFNGTGANKTTSVGWTPDSAAHQYMYGIPQAVIYDGVENSFNPSPGVVDVGDEWKHIRVDITDHIDRCIKWANRDNVFSTTVTKEDMYFSGANIGFEIHGNYDMTVEIKNFNIVAYNKEKA